MCSFCSKISTNEFAGGQVKVCGAGNRETTEETTEEEAEQEKDKGTDEGGQALRKKQRRT